MRLFSKYVLCPRLHTLDTSRKIKAYIEMHIRQYPRSCQAWCQCCRLRQTPPANPSSALSQSWLPGSETGNRQGERGGGRGTQLVKCRPKKTVRKERERDEGADLGGLWARKLERKKVCEASYCKSRTKNMVFGYIYSYFRVRPEKT